MSCEKIRKKLKKLLNEADVMGGSNISPKANVTQGAIVPNDPGYVKTKQKAAQSKFDQFMSAGAYEDKIKDFQMQLLSSIENIKKSVSNLEIAKDEDQSYLHAITQLKGQQYENAVQNLKNLNQAISNYNKQVEDAKNNSTFGKGLETTNITIPHVNDLKSFKGMLAFISQGPHLFKKLIPFVGIDPSQFEETPQITPEQIKSQADAAEIQLGKANLDPKITRNLGRRLRTIKRWTREDPNQRFKMKGVHGNAVDHLKQWYEDFNKVKLTEAVVADPIKKEDTVNAFARWLFHNPHYRYIRDIMASVNEMVQMARKLETQMLMIATYNKKIQKLRNLKQQTGSIQAPTPGQGVQVAAQAAQKIIQDPTDVPNSFDEAEDLVIDPEGEYDEEGEWYESEQKEIQLTENNDHKEETPVEEEKPKYKRQRPMTRKAKLKEAWKNLGKDIMNKKTKTKHEDDPNLHLGGLS